MKKSMQIRGWFLAIASMVIMPQAIAIERISVSSGNEQANNNSYNPSISANGRYTAFNSNADNLVPGDTNGTSDVFVHDSNTGRTQRVSVSSNAEQANNFSGNPVITADGSEIIFSSSANNLADGVPGVFVHHRLQRTTKRLHLPYNARVLSTSASGRYIAFTTTLRRLTVDDNNYIDLYIHDRQTGAYELIPYPQGSIDDYNPNTDWLVISNVSITEDGRYVLYRAGIDPIFDDDLYADYYLYDRENTTHTDYNTDANVILSSNGQFLISRTGANIVVQDRQGLETRKIYAPGPGSFHSISEDGRYLVTQIYLDVVIYDLISGKSAWVNPPNVEGSGLTGLNDVSDLKPGISADGDYITFASIRDVYTEGDTNQNIDIFVTTNPLIDAQSQPLIVNKLINYKDRYLPHSYYGFLLGSPYRVDYQATNNSPERLFNVEVYDNDQLACNLYTLEPGQTKRRCGSLQRVNDSGYFVDKVQARGVVATSADVRVADTKSYYSAALKLSPYQYGLTVVYSVKNSQGKWESTDYNDSIVQVNSKQVQVRFYVKNRTRGAIYNVETFHDPESPVDGGWVEQCDFGTIYPQQIRFCTRTVNFDQSGLNVVNGRVRAGNAIAQSNYILKSADQLRVMVP